MRNISNLISIKERERKKIQISIQGWKLLSEFRSKNSINDTSPLTYDDIIEMLVKFWKEKNEPNNKNFHLTTIN
ncbi:MAG TPA: hypothetical protein VJ697_04340 [Nitrososphaeraceae archaeon]|nr:hypothetical protein [Nitrososphaeraceae archaeon]